MGNKKLKKGIADEQKELKQLLNEWDPIGVLPFEGGPKDEYDCFSDPIISLLHKGKNKKEIIAFLNKHLKEHVGLDPKYSKPEEFADKIMHWWNKKQTK